MVGHGQCKPMPGKLAALRHWDSPKTISELRALMGFCNYYWDYVRMYAELSGALYKMLQVRKFDARKGSNKTLAWKTGVEEAFKTLKQTLLGTLRLFWTKDLCPAPPHRIMPWEQSLNKSERMVPMSHWPFRVEYWRKGRTALGPQGKRRHMP